MCGVTGFVDKSNINKEIQIEFLKNMVNTLNHRGPDNLNYNLTLKKGTYIGLGHTRLAIIDLNKKANQPMTFKNIELVFNGEIYNYLEIKNLLEKKGHVFKTNSDTEVILHSYFEWGEYFVKKLNGMFVIIIFDKNKNKLLLYRDRVGVKPLYYYQKDEIFLFSSELKSFHKHPKFLKKINKNSVYEFIDKGYISSPNSIFENCYKLTPGHYINYSIEKNNIKVHKYWDILKYYNKPKLNITFKEAKLQTLNLLRKSFNSRMISDVPVGIFLSGGIDSSSLLAILNENHSDLKTFTIGFNEKYDESHFAKNISNFIGTEHHELILTEAQAIEICKDLSLYYDEPFADSSAIPTILVSKLAKKNVKVVLSADGGDEIFGGYEIYNTYFDNLNKINKIPQKLKQITSKLLQIILYFIPKSNLRLEKKIEVLSKILKSNKPVHEELFLNYNSMSEKLKSRLFLSKDLYYKKKILKVKDELSFALVTDLTDYLQNDILTKVDRATMSQSIEGRDPFLDHKLIEFIAQLPNEFKIKNGNLKYLLKEITFDYIPENLLKRPKQGFSIPLEKWLKKDLNYLIKENLNEEDIKLTSIFNLDYINELVELFNQNKLKDGTLIWRLIQYQIWYKKWISE